MELINRKFYQQALTNAALAERNETDEDRIRMQEFASLMKSLAASYSPKPDTEKLEWFQGLPNAVIEFAENCDLDVYMDVNKDFIGSILFETNYMELSAFDDPMIRKFWVYLCQHGQLFITRQEEFFSIEFRFDLRAS